MYTEAPAWLGQQRSVNLPTNFDTADFQQRTSSLERKLGRGYNVLAEIDLLCKNPNSQDYVFENELTAACEAIGSQFGGMWSSYRPWDAGSRQFLAFGSIFTKILEDGVTDIKDKVEMQGVEEYRFELNRRQAELDSERRLVVMHDKGYLQNNIFLTISPYPEEVDKKVATSLGYKPEEKLGKLRFEVFVGEVRQTVELAVARGSVRIFQSLIEKLDYDQSLPEDSISFLQTTVALGSSASYLDTILNVVKRYDSLLEEDNKGLYYFCGQQVENPTKKDYEQIVQRQRWVREQGRGLITAVCDLNLELAQSLTQGSSTQMTRETAYVLKKNELVRMWSILSCVINEDRAKQMFGEGHVKHIQGFVESGTINSMKSRQLIDQVIAEVNPVFLACGGSLSGTRTGSLFSLGLQGAKDALFGARDNIGSLFFTCPHISCGKINKRNPGQIRETCEHCLQAIPRC